MSSRKRKADIREACGRRLSWKPTSFVFPFCSGLGNSNLVAVEERFLSGSRLAIKLSENRGQEAVKKLISE